MESNSYTNENVRDNNDNNNDNNINENNIDNYVDETPDTRNENSNMEERVEAAESNLNQSQKLDTSSLERHDDITIKVEKSEENTDNSFALKVKKEDVFKKAHFENVEGVDDPNNKANIEEDNSQKNEKSLKTKLDLFHETESKIARDLEEFTKERKNFEQSFQLIEQDCLEFLNNPGEFDEFHRYLSEYEKLTNIIQKSFKFNYKQFKKYTDLCDSYMENQKTIHEAIQISFENQQILQSLQNQIKKAMETVENNEAKEELEKEELRKLKQEILNLNTTMSRGVNLNVNQERMVNELLRTKEQTMRDLEEEVSEIQEVRDKIIGIAEKIRTYDIQKQEIEQEIYNLKDKNIQKKLEIDMETKAKEKIDRELRELRVTVSSKIQEVHNKHEIIKRTNEENEELEENIVNQRKDHEKLIKEKEQLTLRVQKLQQEYEEQASITNSVINENENLQKELKIKEDDILRNKVEIKKIKVIHNQYKKKIQQLEEQKEEAEGKRQDMKNKLVDFEINKKKEQKFIDHSKRILENLTRESFILDTNIDKVATRTQKHTQYILANEQLQHHIRMKKQRFIGEAAQISLEIKNKKNEIQAISNEIVKIQEECVKIIKMIKQKELKVFDYQKKVMQIERKLKRQQNLYDSLQTDRNLHSNKLIEVQYEIGEMKQKLKIMNYQISGYKETILCKDDLLKTEKADYEKLRKDTDQISEEIKNLKLQNDIAQTYIRNQISEEAKLNKFVKEAELEKSRQENTLSVLVRERDNLSSQWIKQNADLQKAYNNLETIQSSILRGESKYNEKMKEIRQFYEEIWAMKHQRNTLKAKVSDIDIMKNTIYRLESQIIEEKSHVTALEEELKKPINVHRWRQLEGTDPQTLEMIKLHHNLQQKLIDKTKSEKKKDEQIRELEKKYLQLKMILSKKIGSEALEQINEYQQILKDKKMNLKHIVTELEMYQTQSKEYKYIIDELNERINSIKNDYIQYAINNKKNKHIPQIPIS